MNNLLVYDSIKDTLKSGDCLFFSGKGRSSNLIKHFTSSKWSHVGLVLVVKLPPDNQKRLFVMESTTLNDIPDALDGTYRKGVQMVVLSQRLANYDGECSVRQLKTSLTQSQEDKMVGWLFKKYSSNTPYDSSQGVGAAIDRDAENRLARLFGSLFGFNNREDFDKLFCSEMVSQAYIEAGLLPESINASEMLPEDVNKFDFLANPIRII